VTTRDTGFQAAVRVQSRGLDKFTLLHRDAPTEGTHLEWLVCAERLVDKDCDEVVEACREYPLTAPSTVGEDRYPGHRQADTRKVGLTTRTRWIFDLLCKVASDVTEKATALELTNITREPQYVEYRPGWYGARLSLFSIPSRDSRD
jgi:hypothetical protein